MTEYILIDSNDKNTLIDNINTLLKLGWVLHGNTCMTTVVLGNNGVTKYSQALIHIHKLYHID
jgi:hypothetical protein